MVSKDEISDTQKVVNLEDFIDENDHKETNDVDLCATSCNNSITKKNFRECRYKTIKKHKRSNHKRVLFQCDKFQMRFILALILYIPDSQVCRYRV